MHRFMAKVELKQPIVEEIANSIKDAQAVVLVNYSGLTVEQDTILRKELREAGIQYKVYKNTMMNFAFKGTDCESLAEHLHGTNAIAISRKMQRLRQEFWLNTQKCTRLWKWLQV